jgi:hypothetical protein
MVNQCQGLSTKTNGPQSRECSLLYSGTYGPRYSRARWALLTASCSKPYCCASTYGPHRGLDGRGRSASNAQQDHGNPKPRDHRNDPGQIGHKCGALELTSRVVCGFTANLFRRSGD